jgi:hypothetical protein
MNLEGSRGFFGKITGVLVNRICNLERAEGFTCKIGVPKLICKYNSKTRGLDVKIHKGHGLRVDYKETQGLLCKIPRNIDLMN